MSPPKRIRMFVACAALALASLAVGEARAQCAANRSVSGAETALQAAARQRDMERRRGYLAAASSAIDSLALMASSRDSDDIGEYLTIRRNDVARLARDPHARELGSSFATISVTAGVTMGECVLGSGSRGVGGVMKGHSVETRLGDKAEPSKGPSPREVVYQTQQAAARIVVELVEETKEKPESLWYLALLPLAAATYRFVVFLNRRRAVRYICCIPMEVRVGEQAFPGRVFDFSRLGVKLAFEKDAPDDETTTFELHLPNMVIKARRVWTSQMIMGVQFLAPLGTTEMGQFFDLAKKGAGLHRL